MRLSNQSCESVRIYFDEWRYPVGGFLDIDAKAPRLSLLPAKNRLAAQLQVAATGPALPRAYQGLFDIDFALRYQASDRTVRADQLRVNALQFDNVPAQTSALLSMYGPQLAEQSLQGAVLHQLKPEDLALPDGPRAGDRVCGQTPVTPRA